MKKITTLLLLFIFFIASSGMTYSVHYCGGEIEDFSFFGNGKCGCENTGIQEDCCSDLFHLIKIEDQFLKSSGQTSVHSSLFAKITSLPVLNQIFSKDIIRSQGLTFLPRPPGYSENLSALFCCQRL